MKRAAPLCSITKLAAVIPPSICAYKTLSAQIWQVFFFLNQPSVLITNGCVYIKHQSSRSFSLRRTKMHHYHKIWLSVLQEAAPPTMLGCLILKKLAFMYYLIIWNSRKWPVSLTDSDIGSFIKKWRLCTSWLSMLWTQHAFMQTEQMKEAARAGSLNLNNTVDRISSISSDWTPDAWPLGWSFSNSSEKKKTRGKRWHISLVSNWKNSLVLCSALTVMEITVVVWVGRTERANGMRSSLTETLLRWISCDSFCLVSI